MYARGQSDDLPAWANELNIRRMLWKEYGIPFADITIEDIANTFDLLNAETERRSQHGR